jgi:hypothetical protein
MVSRASEWFGQLPAIAQFLLIWVPACAPLWAMLWWMQRRFRADRCHWAVQQQIWEMERQIMDEAALRGRARPQAPGRGPHGGGAARGQAAAGPAGGGVNG